MIRSNQVARWVCIAILPVMLSACGQNIFKGLAGDPERTAEDLNKLGLFSEAIKKADAIIQKVQTGATAQTALTDKAVGIMGANNSLPQATLQVVSSQSTHPSANIVASLSDTLPISPSTSIVVADLFNYANDLSISTNITVIPEEIAILFGISSAQRLISIQGVANNALTSSLNTTAQFRRGFANATVVVKMVTRYLDITVNPSTSQATATLNSTAISESMTSRKVVLYLHNPPRTALYYAENAIDAFQKSESLTESQLKPFKRIKLIGKNFDRLRTIALNKDMGNFILVDENGTAITGSNAYRDTFSGSGTAESKYRSAITKIINVTTGGN